MSTATLVSPDATPAGRREWLEWRQTGVGASEAAAVLGVSQYRDSTPLAVYLRKTGALPEQEETEAMRWGSRLEPLIAEAYIERTSTRIVGEQVCVRSTEHPYMIATLDGLRDDGVVVELKTIGLHAARQHKLGDEGSDEVPFPWLCQAYHQMVAANAERVDIAALIGGQEFRVYPILRDGTADRIIDRIIEAEGEFWDRVLARTPPEPDLDRDAKLFGLLYPEVKGVVDLDCDAAAVALEWERLKGEISAMEKDRDRLKAELLAAMETLEFGRLPDGRVLVRKIAERAGFTVKPSSYVDLRIKKGM